MVDDFPDYRGPPGRPRESYGQRDAPPYPPHDRPREPSEYPPRYRSPPTTRPIFSVRIILALVLAGLILFYVGSIVCIGSINTTKYDRDDYDKANDDKYLAMLMYKIGLIILVIGGLLAHIGLFGGGVANKDIDPNVRTAMVSMGIALLIITILIILLAPSMRSAVGPMVITPYYYPI